MSQYGSLPRARRGGLLEETLGEELLLYDQGSHTAHCLSPNAASVWRHCDGERDVSELAELAGVSKNLVAEALHELREKELLDAEPQLTQSAVPGESRREAIGRIAGIGGAAAGASLIVSAAAATPAMASSSQTCCQCENSSHTKCDCTTCTSAEQCDNWCKKTSTKCGGASAEGFCTGTKCEGTGACTG